MFMITVHELGHYLVGKWLGFRITEFSIGFGKPLYKRVNKKTGEVFAIRMIPLGGYCAFAGADDADAPGQDKEEYEKITQGEEYAPTGKLWDEQAPWRRILTLFAGSFFNFVCAILFCIILIGVVGYNQGNAIHTVHANAVDANGNIVANVNHGNLAPNEVIRAIRVDANSEWQYFTLLNGMQGALGQFSLGDTPTLRIYDLDGNFLRNQTVTIQRFQHAHTGVITQGIGIQIGGIVPIRIGFIDVLWRGFLFSFEIVWAILSFLGALIAGRMALTDLRGPVSTMQFMTEAVGVSPINILLLIPMLSVNLAVFNLLPIPALDGARMIFVGIEWIRKKPVNRDLEGKIHMIGLLCLLAFVLFIEINFQIHQWTSGIWSYWANAPPF